MGTRLLPLLSAIRWSWHCPLHLCKGKPPSSFHASPFTSAFTFLVHMNLNQVQRVQSLQNPGVTWADFAQGAEDAETGGAAIQRKAFSVEEWRSLLAVR